MRQGGYLFSQDPPIGLNVGGAHFEQIVETADDHVAFADEGSLTIHFHAAQLEALFNFLSDCEGSTTPESQNSRNPNRA
jgi:hypothetical protein